MRVNTKGLAAGWFTPTIGNDEEPRARYKIEPLSSLEVMEVEDHMREMPDGKMAITAAGRKLLLLRGISDFEHVRDENGKDLPFSYETLLKHDRLTLNEIAVEVWQRSTMSEDERGN